MHPCVVSTTANWNENLTNIVLGGTTFGRTIMTSGVRIKNYILLRIVPCYVLKRNVEPISLKVGYVHVVIV